MAPTQNMTAMNGDSHMSERAYEYIQTMNANNANVERTERSDVKTAKTLQSVLRGEVPTAYMHLAVPANVCYYRNSDNVTAGNRVVRHSYIKSGNGFRPYPSSSPNRAPMSVHQRGQVNDLAPSHPGRFDSQPVHNQAANTSIYSHMSPQSYEVDAYPMERESPVLESRYSPFQESGSPFIGHHPSPYYDPNSPNSGYGSGRESGSPYLYQRHSLSPYSPHQRAAATPSPHNSQGSPYSNPRDMTTPPVRHSSDTSISSPIHDDADAADQPIDLSKKPAKQSSESRPCILEVMNVSKGSLLRNLLTPGARGMTSFDKQDSGRDTPDSECYKPEVPITGSTRVTLAKKMVYPITSRVSDWLLKIVQFSKSIPEFATMSQNDKLTLLINAWTRMLLFLMAENDSVFAVTPLRADSDPGAAPSKPSPDEPTMKSVDGVQNFMRKCRNLAMDQKEYALLRMAVLFNTATPGLEDMNLVEKLNSAVQQLLQQHVSVTRPNDVMRHSKILMLLPSLYGINCKMVENLFCKRINTDMEVLLKEMLQEL
ncbi:7UP1-like protein [Mya arenaria]|uniref:7UP1-like protein n=1 Tax=Mya arenaria TaxID=6604 RepID=A0ABY7EZ09_MYAAR|nr:uncharacterized protein LOC128203160 [Mya arenaria]XP_052760498.1 uncharacterized protein LOC128203228 [Mya arenaria]WAR15074.1 7UP1-like protein [Mya arenaria]WAR15120.1 7UP1-like protein [Mya arenaria]